MRKSSEAREKRQEETRRLKKTIAQTRHPRGWAGGESDSNLKARRSNVNKKKKTKKKTRKSRKKNKKSKKNKSKKNKSKKKRNKSK